MTFDGIDDYIDLGDVYDDITLPITISAWVYFDPSTTLVSPIFASQDNGPTYNGFWFCASPTSFYIEYGDGQGEGNEQFRRGKSAGGNFIGGRWTHLTAVMVNGNNIQLYINGNDVGGTYTGTSSLPMSSSFPTEVARIGKIFQNNILYQFEGKMDDLRFWNRALSITEIRNGMCKRLSGNEPGLIGNWDFDEVSGSQVIDKSAHGFDGQLTNGPTRNYSGAPIGDESVNLYAGTWAGTVVTMTEGVHTVNVSNVQNNPEGVHIYTVRNLPSQTSGLSAEAIPPYFGVFSAALDENNMFDVTLNNNACGFFTRRDNSEASWTVPASLANTVDRTEVIIGAENAELNVNLGGDESVCPFIPKTLSALANPSGYQFLWQDGSTQPTFQATDYGVYWVKVFNACQVAYDTITFTSQDLPLSIDLGPDEFICPLYPKLLSPLENPTGFEFTWQDGSKQSSFQVSNYGKYWVTVNNGCATASDTITISKPDFVEPFIPNVITPNNDSKNQFFEVDPQLIGSKLKIYNRWGRCVFESADYQNNWDANDLTAGTYFYQLTNPCTENFKGYISVLK